MALSEEAVQAWNEEINADGTILEEDDQIGYMRGFMACAELRDAEITRLRKLLLEASDSLSRAYPGADPLEARALVKKIRETKWNNGTGGVDAK